MLELVGGWCLALKFHAGGQNYGSGSSDSNCLAFAYWTCVISVCLDNVVLCSSVDVLTGWLDSFSFGCLNLGVYLSGC